MEITSLCFLAFFLVIIVVYYCIPANRGRKIWLLVASYTFYASYSVSFLFILIYVTLVGYLVGRKLENEIDEKKWLRGGILLLLIPLFTFKYLRFIIELLLGIIGYSEASDLSLFSALFFPVGISFYTFIALGYLVDVSRQRVQAEHDLLDFSLFIGFFPQLVAGPISRSTQMLPQLKRTQVLTYGNISGGAWMMLWGYFMKLVVGDRAALYVDLVFGNYQQMGGISMLLATFLYTVRIYCDFAGYSLIAIGAGKMLGFNLSSNFCRPYFARSASDFWHRWHISLSSWFRDYIYIPLGGNRLGTPRTCCNLFLTFVISGLWHGAAYTFLLWGAYHGLLLVIERIAKSIVKIHVHNGLTTISKGGQMLLTFITVSFGWLIFVSPDIETWRGMLHAFTQSGATLLPGETLGYFFLSFILLCIVEVKMEFFSSAQVHWIKKNWILRSIAFALLLVYVLLAGVVENGQFIYISF